MARALRSRLGLCRRRRSKPSLTSTSHYSGFRRSLLTIGRIDSVAIIADTMIVRMKEDNLSMKKTFSTFAIGSLMLLIAAATPAAGAIITYTVVLSGTQAVPSNASTATGTAVVTLDDVALSVAVSMSFTGLTGGPASAAHIHCCVAVNANGPVVIPFTGFPTSTSGTYSNTFTGVSVANITGIEAGLAYINIHNAIFPGGEIRGDILAPVPEPTSLCLTGLGVLAVFGGLARRNRRQSR